MSHYGSYAIVDVPPEVDETAVKELLSRGAESRGVQVVPAPAGWRRWAFSTRDIEVVDVIEEVLTSVGRGRAVVGENHDEFGAVWVVLEARDGGVRTVYRRYVLPADPRDAQEVREAVGQLDAPDPRLDDVVGDAAARAVADLWDTDAGPVLEVEQLVDHVWKVMWTLGGPFPWFDALRLPWPAGVRDDGSSAQERGPGACAELRAAAAEDEPREVPAWVPGLVVLLGALLLFAVLWAILNR